MGIGGRGHEVDMAARNLEVMVMKDCEEEEQTGYAQFDAGKIE